MNQDLKDIRLELVIAMDNYLTLLEEFDKESKQLNAYDLVKFNKRIEILDNFNAVVCEYDEIVQDYIQNIPPAHETNKLRDRLKIAQRYIQRLGGDWNNVLWGKLSDY
jgi:hypothetical protein